MSRNAEVVGSNESAEGKDVNSCRCAFEETLVRVRAGRIRSRGMRFARHLFSAAHVHCTTAIYDIPIGW